MKYNVVVDTSVILKWINATKEENLEEANQLLEKSIRGDITLCAPELAKYELGNVLVTKRLTPAQAQAPISSIYSYLPISFISQSEELANETFRIASELAITYYDAAFISLAKEYDATLVTANIKHQGRTKDIEVLALKDVVL